MRLKVGSGGTVRIFKKKYPYDKKIVMSVSHDLAILSVEMTAQEADKLAEWLYHQSVGR
jgi:hypothetical protein